MKYSDEVMDHFMHPRNMGELEDPSGVGQVGNIRCGDVMKIQIKVEDGVIVDIKFKTLGCAAAIASTSVLTELVKGMKLEDAKKIERADIVKALKELPDVKVHCSVLAQDALKEAINDYEKRNKD